jgi:hypothetical protein
MLALSRLNMRFGRVVSALIFLPFLICLFVYLCLLGAEYYSARDVSRILTRLEAIRLGDPSSTFEDAVRGCPIETQNGEYSCYLVAGAFRFDPPWALLRRLPLQQNYEVNRFLDHLGLRFWKFYATARISRAHIEEVSVNVVVVGRYEMLGGSWQLAQQVRPEFLRPDSAADEHRTLIRWFHITSLPSGEGLNVDATPESTEEELRSRSISPKCLFTFRGCDGLCEFLPSAAMVLKERGMGWGGHTEVPKSTCQ